MLADQVQIDDIKAEMKHKEFYIEVKYDGERMLAHRFPNGTFKFLSRNANDFTKDFGQHPREGKFSKYLEEALAVNVQSVILDGEICAFNKKLQVLSNKAEKHGIRSLNDDHDTYQQCLYIYDIVYLNGQVLTNRPLKERLQILREKAVQREIQGE